MEVHSLFISRPAFKCIYIMLHPAVFSRMAHRRTELSPSLNFDR